MAGFKELHGEMQMNLLNISEEIQNKIKEIDMIRKEIKSRGESKADALKEYKKQKAITLIKIKNHTEFELDGNKIKDPPASYTKDIAEGIVFNEIFNTELADSNYKSALVNLDACQSQLTALQSLFRHLDNA
jgi:hypothetical protein